MAKIATKPAKPGRKQGKAKAAALLANTAAVKRAPAKRRCGVAFAAMKAHAGKYYKGTTPQHVWAASLYLSQVAAVAPLTAASERIREIIPELVRMWAVYKGKEMDEGSPHLRRADKLEDELARLSRKLSHNSVGDLVTMGLVAAHWHDGTRNGRFEHSDIRDTAAEAAIWLLLGLGGFDRKALVAFYYSTTPAKLAKAEQRRWR